MKQFTKQGTLCDEELNDIEEPEDEEDLDARSQYTADGITSDEQLLAEVDSEHRDVVTEKVGMVRDKELREGINMLTKVCYPLSLRLLLSLKAA